MKTFADIVAEFGLAHEELHLWVEKRWVLPLEQEGQFTFSDGDVARVQMIVDLRRDLAIDEDAMSVVLDLLDKLYGLRRQMRDLLSAVDELPDTQRDTLLRRIGAIPGDDKS
jgi:chaperone modulatory protein CbpM